MNPNQLNPNYYLNIANIQYLYKDQYGKSVFKVISKDKNDFLLITELCKKIEVHKSINPIIKKTEDTFIIRFNDTKHLYKPRVFYQIIFFIHKNTNKKNKKTYINLHIVDALQKNAKQIDKTLLKDL